MSREDVERALDAARVSHSIQRDQCIVILHTAPRYRDPGIEAIHEQEIADLKQQVKHMKRRKQ